MLFRPLPGRVEGGLDRRTFVDLLLGQRLDDCEQQELGLGVHLLRRQLPVDLDICGG